MVFNFERRPRVQPVTVKMVAEAPEVRASGIAGPPTHHLRALSCLSVTQSPRGLHALRRDDVLLPRLRARLGCSEAVLVRNAVTDEGAAVNRAELTLIARTRHLPGRHKHRAASLHRPTRIIDGRCMLITRNFTADGPI